MPKYKALIVSLENYQNPRHNLTGLYRDVAAFTGVLSRFGIYDLEVLRDANATKKNIQAALNSLVDGASIGDVRIFYFTGHGTSVPKHLATSKGGNEAYVPYEGTTKSLLYDTWIQNFLKVRLHPDVFFYGIYDCCNSGQLYKKFDFAPEVSEVPKEIDFSLLSFEHDEGQIPQSNQTFGIKSFVEDAELKNSVHIGAAEPDNTALVMPINGQKRSVFTWAFEEVAQPGISLTDFEEQVSKAQASKTKHHKPILATALENRPLSMFSH
ncbi:MAG: caspase family protein [Hyphomicrobiales bacterium]